VDIKKLYVYRFDYVLYAISIIILNVIAAYHSQTYIYLIPITIVWFQMVWIAAHDLKKRQIGTEFFLVFATIAAVIGKQERAIMFVLLIMLIARYAELLIEQRTHHAIEKLFQLMPSRVTIMENNQEKNVALEIMTPGMHVLVKTGGRVPADGFVVQGHATINEAMLTGESMPKEKEKNATVFAGTYVESGSIIFQVERVHHETLLSKMTALFAQAEEKKAHITIFTDKIVFFFVPFVFVLIALVWFITGNLEVVITLLIFGSPLELSLVTPLTVLAGSVAAFRHGILVRGGRALEQLSRVNIMTFDKTGTLTLGEPTIVEIKTFDEKYSERDILTIAAIAEIRADHVVATSILKKAREMSIEIPQPEEYVSLVGHGVTIISNGARYFLGNEHFIQAPEHGNSAIPLDQINSEQAYSNFYIATDGKVIGKISVMDTVRADAYEVIQKLKESGINEIILLSGDRQEITETVALQLGIDRAYGQAFPADKLKLLDQLQQQGNIVAMVGDGINDVAALKQANVGIAMGAMGMEPAIEAADIVLMTNDLKNIYFVRRLSQQVFKVIKQNLIIGFFILHILGLVLTLMHLVNPVQAAFFHAVSDVLILLNASRLMAFK
jgi:heavy metal translocating P-type ATPase